MNVPKTFADLLALIENKVEENFALEYKSAEALLSTGNKGDKKDGKTELIKDVSAMANSAGGVIIYGIKEFDEPDKKHWPEKITPIKRAQFSKEQLQHLIDGNTLPRIEGLLIHPIELEKEDEVVYVVEIPQSNTAHQNTKDKRYYRRSNFEATSMLDYEIRDVMNRGSYPKLCLEFEFSTESESTGSLTPSGRSATVYKHYLNIRIRNTGTMYANYVNYFVEITRYFLDEVETDHLVTTRTEPSGAEYVEYYGENTVRDIVDSEYSAIGRIPKYGPSRYDPILPQMHSRVEKLKLGYSQSLHEHLRAFAEDTMQWRIYADNAPVQTGKIKVKDIVNFNEYNGR